MKKLLDVPERERWLYEPHNKEQVEKIKRALKQPAKHKIDLAELEKSITEDEILDLVSAQDEVIGQEKRSIVRDQNLTNFRAVNGFVVNSKKQLWIPRRTAHKIQYPSALDCSVSGCVSAGETYESAFGREVQEELNIDINTVNFRKIAKLTPLEHNTSCFMNVYAIYQDAAPNYNPDDFCEFYWLSVDEVLARVAADEKCKSDLPKILKAVRAQLTR